MRIVGGVWRGRRLATPRGTNTRPTSDRVREAIFSSLISVGDVIEGARVLDAFAGTGALGLEALSRGAASVVFCETDRAALAALDGNIAALDARDRSSVLRIDALRAAHTGALSGPFTLLFADPPYRIDEASVSRWLTDLVTSGALTAGAVVVYEHAAGVEIEWPRGLASLRDKRYGSTTVSIAMLAEESDET